MTKDEDERLDDLLRKALFYLGVQEGKYRIIPVELVPEDKRVPDSGGVGETIYFTLTSRDDNDIVYTIKWP